MRSALLLALVLTACPSPEAPVSATASAPSPQVASASPVTSATAAPVAAREIAKPYPCGDLSCRSFDSADAALAAILDETKPTLVAFGEGHALKGTTVPSTTARFTEQLLPLFRDKASALVLELWAPDPSCGKEKVKAVEKKQQVVTEKQAETNQNEYVKLGEKSREVGVVPFLLKPSCEDYDKVKNAGDDAVLAMIDVITRNMKQKATTLYEETAKKQPGKMLLTYGGALHNDLVPRKGREGWSFAPDLDKLAGGKYVELDLVVPEFIKDTESWKSLPWYGAYDRVQMGGKVVVITVAPRSYAMIFAVGAK